MMFPDLVARTYYLAPTSKLNEPNMYPPGHRKNVMPVGGNKWQNLYEWVIRIINFVQQLAIETFNQPFFEFFIFFSKSMYVYVCKYYI